MVPGYGSGHIQHPKDLNVIVPGHERNKLTVNWANPKAYLLVAGLLAIMLILCFIQ